MFLTLELGIFFLCGCLTLKKSIVFNKKIILYIIHYIILPISSAPTLRIKNIKLIFHVNKKYTDIKTSERRCP